MSNGKHLEQLLETTHHEYQIKKLAYIRKNPETWGFTSENDFNNLSAKAPAMAAATSKGDFLTRKKSDVDFSGLIAPNGKSIKFDAKNVKNGVSIPLSRFTKHQVESGVMNQKFGGFGGFIIYFESVKRAFWVDASIVEIWQTKALFKKGKKSINISEFQHEIKTEHRKIDWLGLAKFR